MGCARPSNKIGEYAELGNVTRDMVKEQEVAFLKTCKARAEENGGKLKFVDINKKESEIEVEGLIETVPGVDLSLLKMDRYTMNPAKDALFRGEFEVNKELLTSLSAD